MDEPSQNYYDMPGGESPLDPPANKRNKLLLLLVPLGLGCVWCCMPNPFAKTDEERWDEMDTPELAQVATSFAKRGDIKTCEDEARARVKRCGEEAMSAAEGFMELFDMQYDCYAPAMHFHRHCLAAAAPNEEVCKRHEKLGYTDAEEWVAETQCRSEDFNQLVHPVCQQVVRLTVQHCSPGTYPDAVLRYPTSFGPTP